MVKLSILISGMHCDHCAQAVETALANLQGVRKHTVCIGGAEVAFDQTAVNRADLFAAIRRAGRYEIAGFTVVD